MTEEVKEECFVIMPFSKTNDNHTEEYWTEHYKNFLKPLIESNQSLVAKRSKPLRVDILREIIKDLVTAPVVVADLTDANPNVYWELGIRQSFRHCTVTIAQEGTKIPFDLAVKGCLFYYPKNHTKMPEFSKQFKESLIDCIKYPERPDSQVLETISGRGTLYQILNREESIRKLEAVRSEIKRNVVVLSSTIKSCNKNIKDRKVALELGKKPSPEYETGRFVTAAVELLTVSRYLDADSQFYVKAENYLDQLSDMNDQLSIWEYKPLSTEHWLIDSYEDTKLYMTKLRKEIMKYQNILSSRL